MKRIVFLVLVSLITTTLISQPDVKLRKKDRKRDVLIQTTAGDIVVRLSDATPLHRDNFLKLVKTNYFDSILFHRVIQRFMIQAGDPNSKHAAPHEMLGNGGPGL